MNFNKITSLIIAGLVLSSTSTVFANSSNLKEKRICGKDRYETATEISKDGWNKSSCAIICRGGTFPDALCSAPLAKKYNAPILLTENNKLNKNTKEELKRLNVDKVFIIGTTGVVSKNVEDEIKSLDGIKSVIRLGGKDRYKTSELVAEQVGTKGEMILATGKCPADGLSISSIAADKGIPIILANDKDSIKNYVKKNKVTKSYIIGGTTCVSKDIENISPNSERISGKNRYETNEKILRRFQDTLNFKKVYLALAESKRGDEFADALVGGALAGKEKSPMVLVNDTIDENVKKYVQSKLSKDSSVIALGSEKVLSNSILHKLADTKVNEDKKQNESYVLDWYQDGNYSGKSAKNASVEQFVVYFNKPVKKNIGKLKLIVPNKNAKDPYGKDKLGVIECSLDGSSKPKALQNVEGGAPATLYIVKDNGKKEVPEGYSDRLVIELTEDWTRILNTEKTGIHYYDDMVKGLRLQAEGLEDEKGNKVEVTSKRDINLSKDEQKPYIVADEPIYTQIGENGTQVAGKTRILFNEPIQLLTERNVEDLKKLNVSQPYVVGSFGKDRYVQYNPITPSQEQLKSQDKGVPVFKAEYRKVDDNGKPILKDGKEQTIKGVYANRGDVFESNEAIDENGDKIKLRLNQLKFKFDFDENNKGITRFRDYGTILISPEECLTEGKWQLIVRNVTDDAGNKMDDYISKPIEIAKYFDVVELTPNKVKIKFTKPFKKSYLWGNKIPLAVTDDRGKAYGFTWINNIKEGQTEAEATFTKPIKNLKGTVYVNTMEYKVKGDFTSLEKPKENTDSKNVQYTDGVYEGEGNGFQGGLTKVKVTIENGEIKNVDVVSTEDSPRYKNGGEEHTFNKTFAAIKKQILKNKSTKVDKVAGATYSSNGIKDAVANALQKAKKTGNAVSDVKPSTNNTVPSVSDKKKQGLN